MYNGDDINKPIDHYFFKEIRIVIFVLKAIGLLPISIHENGKCSFELRSKIVIYSITFFILMMLLVAFDIYNHVQVMTGNDFNFDEKIIHYTAFFMQMFSILPLVSFMEWKKVAWYFSNFIKFEAEYYKLTKKPLVYKMKCFQYVFISYMALSALGFLFTTQLILQEQRDKGQITLPFFVIMILIFQQLYYLAVMNGFLGIWIFLNLGIQKAAGILLNDLKGVKLKLYPIEDLFRLWLDLRNIAEDLGIAYSYSFLYFLVYMFILAMGASYLLLTSIGNPARDTRYGYVGLTLYALAVFSIVGDCAHRTVYNLRNRFGETLENLIASESHPFRKKELQWFMKTLAINPPVVTLSGYVNLDKGFNASMLGMLITYILVILQFRPRSRKEHA